jgi:hypothetical protein
MDLINTIRARRPHCAAAWSTKPSSLPHGPTERDRRSVSGSGPRGERTTITGSFSEFWLRDLYDADGDAL